MHKILYDILRLVKFYFKLSNLGIFEKRNPADILMVIKEFILSESKVYNPVFRKMNRTAEKSALLLATLIDLYIKERKDKTLDEILNVLKTEIIKRKG